MRSPLYGPSRSPSRRGEHTGVPLPNEPMSADAIIIDCDCGRSHEIDGQRGRFKCDCGTVYAVTVTELTPLLDE